MRGSTKVAWTALLVTVVGGGLSSVGLAQRERPAERRETTLSDPEAFELHLQRQTGVVRVPGAGARLRADQAGGGGGAGAQSDLPNILLTGYWPPSNEGVRRFSTDPVQNPQGWIGGDWEGRGYDVHSFFPEFNPPDCSFCGKGDGDLEVDYQDTSADFWRIVDEIRPIAIITFSRGWNDLSWELEMNQYNRSSWIDDYERPFQPTPVPPDDSVPPGTLRLSTLPVQDIVDAVNNAGLGLNAYICYAGDGGGFLSEFIAYHGVWYQDLYRSPADPDWCIAGGHVHVGGQIDWATAKTAVEVSLREVIGYVDDVRAATTCQQDLGFGGPGTSELRMCGGDLGTGTTADFQLSGALPGSVAFLLVGLQNNPTSFAGGTLIPIPPLLLWSYTVDERGRVLIEDVPGGGGPLTVFAQFAHLDPSEPLGFSISNALQIEIQP